MSVAENQTESEYSDFKLQFDDQYGFDVSNGHKQWMDKELIPEIRAKFLESDPYRILAVGSGTGYPDVGLLESLSNFAKGVGQERRKIVYTVVEPDPKAVEVCKRNLDKVAENLNIDFKYEVVSSEKFLLQLEKEFELIHFVHVISWLKEHEKVLARCYEKMLVKGGLIALVDFNKEFEGAEGHSEENKEEQVHAGDEERVESGDQKTEEGEEQDALMLVEVDLIAKKFKWSCRKFPYEIKIDLTEVSKETKYGKKLALSWIHADTSKMNEEEMKKCRDDLLKSLNKEEVHGETRYFFSLYEMIYFLNK